MPHDAAKPASDTTEQEGATPPRAQTRRRADARRNIDALIEAARTVFDTAGVDAPAKQITDLAGVGVGTLYRHFPQRSDLVKAVVQSGIDAVAAAGTRLGETRDSMSALSEWIDQFVELLGTKRGLASALHSGDPAFDDLPGYFTERLGPTLTALLDAAAADGAIRDDFRADELLLAIALLCQPLPGREPELGRRLTAALVDGLRFGADRTGK
ncbi:TetR/AcrR family transcriptional regulator [Amycolatopsis pigmentata]|uniref:TetR/AcrR family transcriptional regulator n=1 Tax=Amycolatopsis pigmentata TaxID=450801 RepID=A0ABW5FRF1_9PSEU